MGNTSSTQFVKEGGRVAAQSFKPCHLFGDSDLYGLGVRLGFYLQYFAAIIAIYFIAVQELRQLRIGLNIIATAIFIALLVNSTQDSLVILDWTILIQLALVFPVYTAPELIVDNYIEFKLRRNIPNLPEILVLLSERGIAHVDDAVALHVQNLSDLLAWAQLAQAVQDAREHQPRLMNQYIAAAQQYREGYLKQDPNRMVNSIFAADDSVNRLHAIVALETDFRTIESRILSNREEVEKLIKLAESIAKDKEKMDLYYRVFERYYEENREDKLAEEFSRSFLWLLLALFLFVMPWLYFRGINNGRKEGCDVKILFVFAPISIYNSHFVGYLRFCAVVGCIIGVVALMISYANISKWRATLYPSRDRWEKLRLSAPNFAGQTQTENLNNGDPNQLPQPTPGTENTPRPDTTSESKTEESAVSKLRKEVENSRKKYFRLYAITICPLLLIITVVLVEMTLKVNHLDMDRSPLESTSQILSFVIGLFISVTVLWHCYVENIKRENESLLEQLLKVGNRIVHGHVHPGPRHERTDDEEQGLVGQTRPEMRQVELQA